MAIVLIYQGMCQYDNQTIHGADRFGAATDTVVISDMEAVAGYFGPPNPS